ncbi:hypothetical protein [Citrobacter freundii]|uniref:hypothetical protein n=1 Tax=Citrobacter freundii TaxID=546 RepID=UPI0015AE09BE|nr:hypothetical protein [Citrobacter freundii]QLD08046.1 hypothetical protein HXS83_16900 [Citrobacter freundii]
MSTNKNDNVKQLVARLKEIQQQSNVTIPAWMLDENRYGKGALTLDEQHEWAETVCQSMRSTVALTYLIECEKRWGLRDGEYQFKTGEFVFGLTRELIENLLVEHVEGALIEQKPQERYLSVFQFYYANDQRLKEDGHSWFAGFLDDIFVDLAARLCAGENLSVKPVLH